jgi:hypothetical protein
MPRPDIATWRRQLRELAIDPSEDAVSIDATNATQAAFAAGDLAPAALRVGGGEETGIFS